MKFIKYLLLLAIVFTSCKGKEGQDGGQSNETSQVTVVEKSDAVCIAAVSIRKDPFRTKDNYITALSIGEKIIYLGKTEYDSVKGTDYHMIELSDGKTGWAQNWGILIDAKPAAIIGKTPIYKRPDLVTKSNENLAVMDFVAIVGEKGEWVEVVSADRKKKGWIPSKRVITTMEDVATATLALKSLYDKNGNFLIDNVQAFLDELPYEGTQFRGYLQDMLDEQAEDAEEAIIESIQTYEEVE